MVEIRMRYEKASRSTGERHEYRLMIDIENVGSVTLRDYRVDIRFPKDFMDEHYGAEVLPSETETHKLIRRTGANFPQYPNGLFPGDLLTDELVKYSVDSVRYHSGQMGKRNLMQLPVEVTVVADGMAPQRVTRPIRELQEF